MNNFQKGFGLIGLLIILGLVIVGGGAYLYVQNKPTAPVNSVLIASSTLQASTQVRQATPVGTEKKTIVGDISFVVPSGWNSSAPGTYTSPDFVPFTSTRGMGYNDNLMSQGIRIDVKDDNSQPVTMDIDSPEAFVNFEMPVLKDCSDCSLVKKMYVDGVAAVWSQMKADDHGGRVTIAGRNNHKGFSFTIYYPDSYASVSTIFDQFLQNVHILNQSADTVVSVPSMSKYTDKDFGFSFWYPSGWQVTSVPVSTPSVYGGTIIKRYQIKGTAFTFDIDEFYSPTKSLAYPAGTCGYCAPVTYYFDSSLHQWMHQYPQGIGGAPDMTDAQLAQTKTPQPADVSKNTMGGLHVFSTEQRENASIIPLSATDFLIVGEYSGHNPTNEIQLSLVNTILATDPSVAIPVSSAQQTSTIQAEKDAYMGQ